MEASFLTLADGRPQRVSGPPSSPRSPMDPSPLCLSDDRGPETTRSLYSASRRHRHDCNSLMTLPIVLISLHPGRVCVVLLGRRVRAGLESVWCGSAVVNSGDRELASVPPAASDPREQEL